jgi:hypothetical protein
MRAQGGVQREANAPPPLPLEAVRDTGRTRDKGGRSRLHLNPNHRGLQPMIHREQASMTNAT